jgi:indole-3-acetate monooxygenase
MTDQNKAVLQGIRDLTPHIIARTAEIEAARRIPLDIVQSLKAAGIFRMFVPRSHGGLELALPDGLEIIRTLGRVDGSVGWTAMIGSGSTLFAALLPRETYDRIYARGPDVIFAGSSQPAGLAEMTADGWRVNGRWPFVSGCQHADWIMGFGVVKPGGTSPPEPGLPAGALSIRGFALPASEWQIEDTWNVAGLEGTGSHHVSLNNATVPETNSCDPINGDSCLPGPLYQTIPQLLPLLHATITLSMAEGALDDIVALANTGRRQFRATSALRESEIFQSELGRLSAELRAAQAFYQTQVASHWCHALAGTLKNETQLAHGTQAAIWICTTCVRIADACFALGGGSSIYDGSPLQRRMRDLHVAAQHAVAHQRHYVGIGKLLLGSSDIVQNCKNDQTG